jgi:hypothetical protein
MTFERKVAKAFNLILEHWMNQSGILTIKKEQKWE